MWYILLLAFIGYITLYLVSTYLKKHRGPILGITCFSFLIFCEFYLVEEMEWHKIRGAQMLLVMRIISIAFDTDFGTLEHIPSPFEFMGYICCCGTCIFGPWIPYKNYISLCDRTPLFICVSLHRWLIAYRDAFAFRSSHYFISFLSEASAMISGFGNESDSIWSFVVTRPLSIEAPRSLVEVVIYWNRPMHYWFKTYVFRSTRPLGSVAAVLSTYIVSILMHGLNFQLAAVLFSLGGYTYVEFSLRHKLAQVFDACIEAHPCRQRCSHRHKAKQLSTKLANVGFGILTMFHLSYLGVMFDMSSTLQEKGYSYSHTLSKWSNLHFASLWVVLGTYIFYLLI
uniref:Protein-serine O-palmitoleoyltransferase porcupine n=2 Tax=Timema shepardi TaxID=629360 RepID=A0A7R9G4K5_TIMSH|nr:unnamed protein product [Timema shepardi]